MTRSILVAASTVTLAIAAAPAAAQMSDADVLRDFAGLAESVVRIRTVADLNYSPVDHRVGQDTPGSRPYSVDGTGVVVGRTRVDGNIEYLILTNHHVADASNYVLEDGGYLRVNPRNTMAFPRVAEESYLMKEERDSITGADMRLIELVRRVQGDMTLMRTIGAQRELGVFEGEIGYRAGEIAPGHRVVTSGYPWGRHQIAAIGTILEVDFPHDLGIAHADFVVDLPVEPGQSGGPVFLVEEGEEGVVYRLIGLVHAKDRERNYAVPFDLWEEALPDFPAELQERLVR
ncbi:MAG TPA: serine protease [Longimicrobiaceae bacterium]|nr:serine protease [Longimicrobiaceae bacterium]